MTQRTKTELGTQITTLAADNSSGDISASDIRSLLTDTRDSLVGGPASATDNTLPRFDSTTGQLVQTTSIVVADTTMAVSGIGMITCNDDAGLQTTTTTTDKLTLGAYDVDGTAYKVFATLTAADVPLCAFTQPAGSTLTWDGGDIGGVTPAAGAFTTLAASGATTLNSGAGDVDFTVNKDTAGAAIIYNAGTDALDLDGATITATGSFVVEGAAVFNEASADVDFRVESNGNANAIFVDAGNDRVGILNGAPAVALDVTGAITSSTTVTAAALALVGTATLKVATILLTATELGGSETNTSFTFPANGAILLNAWLNVTDAEAATVDVGTQGTSNDPNGIMEAANVSATGYAPTVAGALLQKFITGGDEVSVTASGDLNSCEATLYLAYLELPAPA